MTFLMRTSQLILFLVCLNASSSAADRLVHLVAPASSNDGMIEAGDRDVCRGDVYNRMETASISRENIALFNLLMEIVVNDKSSSESGIVKTALCEIKPKRTLQSLNVVAVITMPVALGNLRI